MPLRYRPIQPLGLPPLCETESTCKSRTTIRRENRKSWRERRASNRNRSVAQCVHPMRARPRLPRLKRQLRTTRLPETARENRATEHWHRRSGTYGPATSRPGGRPCVAGSFSRGPTVAPRVEIRERHHEPARVPVPRAASPGKGLFRIPVPVRRLRRSLRSVECRQRGNGEPRASRGWIVGVLGPACRDTGRKAALPAAPALLHRRAVPRTSLAH